MAGMFYSLEEAAEKLNKTKDELKQIVKEGRLREFRDGPNVLFKVEEIEALASDMAAAELEAIPELEPEETPTPSGPEPEIPELEAQEPEAAPASEEDLGLDEILLAPETGTPVLPDDLTDADTALTGQGTSVLGQTDKDYEITDDTMADTVIPPETSSEVPLEEIEEDVNLDTFGSGSGLLDLSLQADDTSLGGILDEIYTAEGEGQEVSEAAPEEAIPAEPAPGPMIAEEELAAPPSAAEVPALASSLIEVTPDKQSNILGILLFLPLLVVIYTTIVAVAAGVFDVVPSIHKSIQGFIWYIVAAAIVATGIVAGASFMLGGERETSAKPAKVKKEKPPKIEKPKKEKKSKKEKPPKK